MLWSIRIDNPCKFSLCQCNCWCYSYSCKCLILFWIICLISTWVHKIILSVAAIFTSKLSRTLLPVDFQWSTDLRMMVCTLKTTGSLFMEKRGWTDLMACIPVAATLIDQRQKWSDCIWMLNQLRNQLLGRSLKCTGESSWDLNSSWLYPSQSYRLLIHWLKQMEIGCFSSTGCCGLFCISTAMKEIFSLWNFISSPHHAVSCCTSHWIELTGTSLYFLLQPPITLSLPLVVC